MKVLVATEKPFAKVAVDGIRKEIEAAALEFCPGVFITHTLTWLLPLLTTYV